MGFLNLRRRSDVHLLNAETRLNRPTVVLGMDDALERFQRLVRSPVGDELVITPPQPLLDEIERLGSDPRRPRTAIARWASSVWVDSVQAAGGAPTLEAGHAEKETIQRPTHYPAHWGLDLIPYPSDLGGTITNDRLYTGCYTSLSTPRPFDPHLHGTLPNAALGFGYHLFSESGFPDQYDITARRGGGPRGGFAFTTGPTEGAYPSAVLPQPTFNLGELGFSNGGWNPEGLQYTNRPKRLMLGGLRNGWAHKVMFARSRRVGYRNIYGPVAVDEATPRASLVVINGLHPLHGIKNIRANVRMNAPSVFDIEVNNVAGRRSGAIREGDVVQVFASARLWANPPLVFTGFVSSIREGSDTLTFTATDTLGYLSREVLTTSPAYYQSDAASIIKDIAANSTYNPPIGNMTNTTNFVVPQGLDLSNRSRLAAIQTILSLVNATPTFARIYADRHGVLHLRLLKEIDDADNHPLNGGALPRTGTPQDFYPSSVSREDGDVQGFNVVQIINEEAGISVSVPDTTDSRYPSRPVVRIVRDKSITQTQQARLLGEQYLQSQGAQKSRWTVVGRPERLDIEPGDIIEFATSSSALSGRFRVFDVRWNLSPSLVEMTLVVGRPSQDLLSSIRLASDVSL